MGIELIQQNHPKSQDAENVSRQQEGIAIAFPEEVERAQVALNSKEVPEPESFSTIDKTTLDIARRDLHHACELLFSNSSEASVNIDNHLQAERVLNGLELPIKNRVVIIGEPIARGGYGAVFNAEIVSRDGQREPCAIKFSRVYDRTMQYAYEDNTPQEDVYAQNARQLIREAAILREMTRCYSDSSAFPQYIDAQFVPNPDNTDLRVAVLVMENVEGMNLHDVIDHEMDLRKDPEAVYEISIEICNALQALHEAGFAHSDIKPSNICLRFSDGIVKVLDFGLASYLGGQKNDEDDAVVYKLNIDGLNGGTRGYQPSKDIEPSIQRDIYSIGRTMQAMLFGNMEIYTSNLMQDIVDKGGLSPELRELYEMTLRMTDENSEMRPSLAEVIEKVQELWQPIKDAKELEKQKRPSLGFIDIVE